MGSSAGVSPVMFILFTYNFFDCVEDYSKCTMYADDTLLLLSRSFLEQLDAYLSTRNLVNYGIYFNFRTS